MIRPLEQPFWGWHIDEAIAKAIEAAQSTDDTLSFEFNGVEVHVVAQSDPVLIYRDWDRALRGYIAGPIGPMPAPSLTAAERTSDARIKAENDRQEAVRRADYERRAAMEKARLDEALTAAPAMERDEAKWAEDVAAQKGDGYGLGVYGFAEAWARLMQARIAAGENLTDVAEECSGLAARGFDITGFMYGCAVQVLAHSWVHGEALRRWRNGEYGVGADREGVVNPAILTVRVPDEASSLDDPETGR